MYVQSLDCHLTAAKCVELSLHTFVTLVYTSLEETLHFRVENNVFSGVQLLADQNDAMFRLEALQEALPDSSAGSTLRSQLMGLGLFADAQALYLEIEDQDRSLKVSCRVLTPCCTEYNTLPYMHALHFGCNTAELLQDQMCLAAAAGTSGGSLGPVGDR